MAGDTAEVAHPESNLAAKQDAIVEQVKATGRADVSKAPNRSIPESPLPPMDDEGVRCEQCGALSAATLCRPCERGDQ